jgi:hypothetical protein
MVHAVAAGVGEFDALDTAVPDDDGGGAEPHAEAPTREAARNVKQARRLLVSIPRQYILVRRQNMIPGHTNRAA